MNRNTQNQRRDGFRVSQDPKSLNVMAGENVSLKCTFESHTMERAKVLWFWGAAGDFTLSPHHPFYKGRIQMSNLEQQKLGEATLILSAVEERDSSLYQCCVQINWEKIGLGEGTMLSVTGRNKSQTAKTHCPVDWFREIIMYRVGVSLGAVAFLAMMVLLLWRCKETITKTRQQQPSKRYSQAGGETDEVLHYAEINLTPQKPVEYASVQTHPGKCTEYASIQIRPL
ncbi:uncharacterized protein LOC112548569 [Alligator sinensis]|uniref:Uncharacterized protein LOC112548569 n=1 Tax=Alligator sinensis TaxID=38654 RepID=A0A3Q0FXM1_ALLSI|nr:uncharacterized protein LOC112548569 [Alligator sinensis]